VSPQGEHAVATNRRARHDYAIEERYEAGIVLTGSEVKSLRQGRASLAESFARVQDGEVWIDNLHIPPYESGDKRGYDPKRRRKLLLKRAEIERLVGKTAEKGLTLVPMRVYFTHGIAKLELGLGRGKRQHDKRQDLAKRDAERETARSMAPTSDGS
jgi:SsrA-binding protein